MYDILAGALVPTFYMGAFSFFKGVGDLTVAAFVFERILQNETLLLRFFVNNCLRPEQTIFLSLEVTALSFLFR